MKPARLVLLTGLLSMVLSTGSLAHQAKDDKAEVALQAAIKTETVDGNLKGAIEQEAHGGDILRRHFLHQWHARTGIARRYEAR